MFQKIFFPWKILPLQHTKSSRKRLYSGEEFCYDWVLTRHGSAPRSAEWCLAAPSLVRNNNKLLKKQLQGDNRILKIFTDLVIKEATWSSWSPWSDCRPSTKTNCDKKGQRSRHRFCSRDDPTRPTLLCQVSTNPLAQLHITNYFSGLLGKACGVPKV